jgi:electron transport complex protein RnfE
MKRILRLFSVDLLARNPALILLLGMCSSLIVTLETASGPAGGVTAATEIANGLGIGITAAVVLLLSNTVVSLLHRFIPGQIRLVCYALVFALVATCADLFMQAVFPHLPIGALLPVAAAGFIIYIHEKAFEKGILYSLLNSLVMGAGFMVSLLLFIAVRGLLADGSRFGLPFLPSVTALTAGGFVALGFAAAAIQFLWNRHRKKRTVSGVRGEGEAT